MTVANAAPAGRRRFQFSLWTALRLVAAVAVCLAMWLLYREHSENRRLREENTRLRNDTGELSFEPGQEYLLHVLGMQTLDQRTWRWMLYVPLEGKFVLHATVGQVPRSGAAQGESMSLPLQPGQSLLVLGIRRDLNGKLQWMLEARGQLKQLPVPTAPGTWIENGSDVITYTGHAWGSHQILNDPKEGLELMRLRIYPTPQPPNVPLLTPADGVLMWISEEQTSPGTSSAETVEAK